MAFLLSDTYDPAARFAVRLQAGAESRTFIARSAAHLTNRGYGDEETARALAAYRSYDH